MYGWVIIGDIEHYMHTPTLHTDFTLDILDYLDWIYWINCIL